MKANGIKIKFDGGGAIAYLTVSEIKKYGFGAFCGTGCSIRQAKLRCKKKAEEFFADLERPATEEDILTVKSALLSHGIYGMKTSDLSKALASYPKQGAVAFYPWAAMLDMSPMKIKKAFEAIIK